MNQGAWSFARDRGGATTVFVALMLTVLLSMVALGIDTGSIYLQSRRLQGMADLAALAAANDLPRAQAAAEAAVTANGWSAPIAVQVATGAYSAQKALKPKERFVTGDPSPNAVRVVLKSRADLSFAQILIGRNYLPISRTATAARADLASFSIGSRLAGVQGGVANALLSALTGSSVSLTAMDYNALAASEVSLFDYTDALRTDLHLTGASYDTVLSSEVSRREALNVLAEVLDEHGQDTAAVAMRKIAAAASAATPAELDRLIDLGPYSSQDHVAGGKGAGIRLNALDLTNAMLTVADGGRQVKLDLGATVPGLAGVTAWLGIGERPESSNWLKVGADGDAVAETSQTRLYIEAKAAPSLSVLQLLGVTAVRLPVLVQLASAKAALGETDCADALADRSVNLSVQPSIGHVSIADIDTSKIDNFAGPLDEQPAMLVNLLVLKASGQARTDIGGMDWQTVRFTQDEITAGVTKTVSSNDIAQATTSSLLGKLQMQVQVAGLGAALGKGPVTSAVSSTLAQAAAPLDGVVGGVSDLLGLHLGQADVRVNGLRCKNAALVA